MKKILVPFLMAIALLFLSRETVAMGITVGAKGGPSLGKLDWGEGEEFSEEVDRSFSFGSNIGAVVGISPISLIEIETGLGFTQKGEKYSDKEEGVEIEVGWKFGYLAIPVLCKVAPPLGLPVKPYGIAGIGIGIPMSGKEHMHIKIGETETDTTMDIKDEMGMQMDLGLNVGIGVAYSIGKLLPFVEFIYDFGLVDMAKPEDATVENKETTRTILINVGIKFKIQ